MAEFTEDDYIELAAALEMHRALHVVAEVSALPVGGKDADAPTPFQAGYQLACEEIAERIRTQEVVIPGGAVLPQCGTLPSVSQPAPLLDQFLAAAKEAGVTHLALTRCAAGKDGDCTHWLCPQLRDGEPKATGRHCPLDT